MADKKINKESIKKDTPKKKLNVAQNIIGLSLLLGVISIAYSSAYIILGTNGWVPLVLVAPQIILGANIAVNKFCK